MLNAVDFNKDATYEETESFVVRLESNGVAVGTITVPVKLAPGAAQIITDNMIKTNVFGSSEWSTVKQTMDSITARVGDAEGRISSIEQTVDGIDLSVYDTIESVNIKTGAITTGLVGMGINIDSKTITIGGTSEGKLIVDTANFKLDENGNVTLNGSGTFNGTVTATDGEFNGTVNANSGVFQNCEIGNGCTIKNDNGWNLVGDSTGRGWKLDGVGTMTVEFYLRYQNKSGGDINKLHLNNGADGQGMFQLNAQTADGISIYTPNNTAIYVSSGESIFNDIVTMKGSKTSVKGLHVSTYSMSSTGTIPATYDVVTFKNTSAITATLPSASSYNGKVLFLKKLGSGSVTLKGTIIPANGTGTMTSTESVGANKSMMYISNGSAWIEYYCG